MDANLIYEKTAAGEDAVRQRTKLVQRNTRMVLILVDGTSTVEDLCAKTGNAQMVETALSDLERDGLIAPKLSSDSVWEQSRKVAEEIKAAAVSRLAKEEERQPEPSMFNESISPPSLEPFSMAPHSIFAPDPAGGVPKANLGSASIPPPLQQAESAPEEPVEKRSLGSRLSGLLPKRSESEDEGISPIRRGSKGPYISLPLWAAIIVVGIAALLAGVFFFYPYGNHRAAIESAISRYLGQPVTIGDIHASLSPPSIVIERVATRSGDMQVSAIQLVPEFFSLLGSTPSFSSVRLDGSHLADRSLAALPAALSAAGDDVGLSIRRVQFSRMDIGVLGLVLSDLQGEVRLAPNTPVASIELSSSDRSARISLKPQTTGLSGDFEAYAWKPFAESKYQFDSIQGQLLWDGRSLSVRSLDARIFDGAVQGALVFDLAAAPMLTGDLTAKHMNVRRLMDGLGQGSQYEGELSGELKFSGSAARWNEVLAGSVGEGGFTIQRGVLGGFDLAEAVRRAGRSPLRGGVTRYEQATGRIRVGPEVIRLDDIVINAGILRAAGTMEVARDGKLGGRLDVEMRGSASAIRMPVALSGSLKEPLLQGSR